jgi:hypothetical protein
VALFAAGHFPPSAPMHRGYRFQKQTAFPRIAPAGHSLLLKGEMKMASIMQWLARARRDPRHGDPYLEALVRQLLLLGGGEFPHRHSPRSPR